MNSFFIVQSGFLKNRKIEFIDSKKGHSNYTSAIIKKAIFDKLESESLQGKIVIDQTCFIDLFAGSAQMGVEAISRGFYQSHCFEIDSKRYKFMKKNLSAYSDNLFFYNKDSFRFYNLFPGSLQYPLVYFLDPPYSFWEESEKMYNLITEIKNIKNCRKLYVQSPIELNYGRSSRRFGKNFIVEIS